MKKLKHLYEFKHKNDKLSKIDIIANLLSRLCLRSSIRPWRLATECILHILIQTNDDIDKINIKIPGKRYEFTMSIRFKTFFEFKSTKSQTVVLSTITKSLNAKIGA